MNVFFHISISAILVLLFHSCAPSKKEKEERVLHVNIPENPSTMDPRKGSDLYGASMHALLFEGLTKISPTSSGDYGIAYKISLSEDKLTYTFHLREALWSNNTPITAYDFEYSWKTMLDPLFPCPNANLLYPILNAEEAKKGEIPLQEVGVYAIDDKTLVVRLKSPTPYFLNLTSFSVFSPVCKEHVEKHIHWAEQNYPDYVCNGPYRLVSWKHHDEIILEKNPNYWDQKEVDLKEIHVSLVSSEYTALEMFKNKELDILGSPYTTIPMDVVDTLKQGSYLQTCSIGKTLISCFNMKKKPFNHLHIRKALSLAIDREAIVSTVGSLGDLAALNFVPPVLKHGKNIPLIHPFDIQTAQEHFQEGLKEMSSNGETLDGLTMIYPSSEEIFSKIAQILQEQWQKHLNIKVSIESVGRKEFLTRISAGDFDICLYHWIAQYDDPMNILDRFKTTSNPKNYPRWENKKYAHLLDLSAFLSGEEREALLQEAEKIIMEEMPIAPLLHSSNIHMIQPYVKGVYSSSLGTLHLHKIRFEKKLGKTK